MKIEEKPDLSCEFSLLPSWMQIMSSYVISRNGQTNLDESKSDRTLFLKHELNQRESFLPVLDVLPSVIHSQKPHCFSF